MAGETTQGFTVPQCDSCSRPAVLEQAYSGRILCNEHMAKSVRKKIAKELRQQLVLPKDKDTTIFVAISGGKDSAVLLDSLVDLIGERPDLAQNVGGRDREVDGHLGRQVAGGKSTDTVGAEDPTCHCVISACCTAEPYGPS